MNKRVSVLREAVGKIVQILAGSRIEVTQRGVRAFVESDPKGRPLRLNLPYVPDNATDEFVDALHGYLDHEVGHLLESDFAALGAAKAAGYGQYANIVEDPREERAISQRFRGAQYNLDNVGRYVLKHHTLPALKEAAGDAHATAAIMLMPVCRALAGQPVFQDFVGKHSLEAKPIFDAIGDLEPQFLAMRSTADACELAKIIAGRMGAEGDQPKDGGGSSAKADNVPALDEEGEAPEVALQEEADEDASRSTITVADAKIGGFDEALEEVLSAQAKAFVETSNYRVYTTDFDRIEPFQPMLASASVYSMCDRVDHMVRPLQKQLERIMAARSLAVWSGGFKSGRMDGAALVRLNFGDDRIFARKQETRTKEWAVELLVDMSGSMGGTKIRTACDSAYALASVLERMGIKVEVLSFSTRDVGEVFSSKDFERCTGGGTAGSSESMFTKGARGYSRIEPLNIAILKSFTERVVQTRERFAALPDARAMLKNNVDGECVEIAAKRLLARPEAGKLLIVLSDGQPNAHGNIPELKSHLKRTVRAVEKSGVKVFGIGIEDNAVSSYYSSHVVIKKASELPSTIMTSLKKLLFS
ncbi:cobaltochelatase CobT-related protein [Burkholderia gladioli]|uniref:cobaltochelatase CobT-related protein n=1 Tax=Burkholderia gladioli TaxID=28095 RepID=UPI003B502E25